MTEVCDCENPDTCGCWIPEFPTDLNNYEKSLLVLKKGVHREGKVAIDMQTANALKIVYENLKSEKNRQKYMTIDLVVLAHKCWKVIGECSA